MISVEAALDRIFALAAPIGAETVPLRQAGGRLLAAPVAARWDQPPFAASIMDGYAIPDETARPGARYRLVGEAAAGHGYDGALGPGEAVRILTGAPVPQDARRVVIQEDVSRDGDTLILGDDLEESAHIRPRGADFREGETIFPRTPLGPSQIALIAAMGHGHVRVARRPEVAIIATGDELVPPGTVPGPGQIVASNNYGLAAMIERAGGRPRLLPIARDTEAALGAAFDLARGADLILTIGGASVGDHDLVAQVAAGRGLDRAFYKVAMRPGKPLMAGRLDGTPMIGLPGNPVSAMVCGTIFVLPFLRVLQGLPAEPAPRHRAPLATPLPTNGPRAHYMRARLTDRGLDLAGSQDSALLSVLGSADVLVIRPPHDPPREAGGILEYVLL